MVISGSPKRWDRWHSPSPNWFTPKIVIDGLSLKVAGKTFHHLSTKLDEPITPGIQDLDSTNITTKTRLSERPE